jgi:hypothetical protein
LRGIADQNAVRKAEHLEKRLAGTRIREIAQQRANLSNTEKRVTFANPEIAEARAATLKAMKEAEQGWQRAIDKVGERAGLTKGPDGTWHSRSTSDAA